MKENKQFFYLEDYIHKVIIYECVSSEINSFIQEKHLTDLFRRLTHNSILKNALEYTLVKKKIFDGKQLQKKPFL